MGVANPMSLTLGEWEMIVRARQRAHSDQDDVAPPTDAEFETAMLAARGLNGH